MEQIATTKMSSKGQVVIPEEIRKKLGLKPGSRFVVMSEKDVVVLRAIETPLLDEFDSLINDAREAAKKVGLKKNDIMSAISEARSREDK